MKLDPAALIAAFTKANPAAARAIFDARIAGETDPDARAKLELSREYLCNPDFRGALEAHSFAATGGKPGA